MGICNLSVGLQTFSIPRDTFSCNKQEIPTKKSYTNEHTLEVTRMVPSSIS